MSELKCNCGQTIFKEEDIQPYLLVKWAENNGIKTTAKTTIKDLEKKFKKRRSNQDIFHEEIAIQCPQCHVWIGIFGEIYIVNSQVECDLLFVTSSFSPTVNSQKSVMNVVQKFHKFVDSFPRKKPANQYPQPMIQVIGIIFSKLSP